MTEFANTMIAAWRRTNRERTADDYIAQNGGPTDE